jgi:3-dehydroquinate dehydratase
MTTPTVFVLNGPNLNLLGVSVDVRHRIIRGI